jgi:hypothetical protein
MSSSPQDRRRRVRLLAPLMLIVLGTWLLSGCVFIPTFGVTTKGRNAASEVGEKFSWSKLKTNRATMSDVVRVLGAPPYASADGRQLAYTWQALNGWWVWPFCFTAQSDHSYRTLVLTFDEGQVLRDYKVLKDNEGLQLFVEVKKSSPVPPNLQPTGVPPPTDQ